LLERKSREEVGIGGGSPGRIRGIRLSKLQRGYMLIFLKEIGSQSKVIFLKEIGSLAPR
jgi:hypothetical protein